MKAFFKKIPLPMTGLMLALAAAGNLVQSYGEIYRSILGAIATILFVLLVGKILIHPGLVKEELKNPVVASVFPTLTMGMMLLATYLKTFSSSLAFIMWLVSVGGHICMIFWFSIKYLLNFDMKKVFPSWFIVYVGIVVGSVTGPAFAMESIGKILFWIGLISYFLLLPVIIKRVRMGTIPEAARPTLIIFAAPVALSLAGYISSFASKNMLMVWGLLVLSQVSYVFVLVQLPKLINTKFYPSFSGFTFPLVISAISIKLTNGFLTNSGQGIPFLRYVVLFEEVVAVLIVLYVLMKYTQFLLSPMEKQVSAPVGK